jgi:hypothetical protein
LGSGAGAGSGADAFVVAELVAVEAGDAAFAAVVCPRSAAKGNVFVDAATATPPASPATAVATTTNVVRRCQGIQDLQEPRKGALTEQSARGPDRVTAR